jgi:putative long chain acyl-CoA synthase
MSNALGLTAPLGRVMATAVNGLEYARFGGLRTDEESSPYEVVAHEPVYRLRRYFPGSPASTGPPVLLVPPLMMTAEVWDVSPATSAVAMLHAAGIEPWVVDFGDPDREPGGAERNVTDHVLAVAEAIERVTTASGSDVHLGGYSQGGLFCYQAAAYRACRGVASIIALGTPVEPLPIAGSYLPETLLWDIARLETYVLSRSGVPRWAVQRMFKWSNPAKALRSEINYLRALHDRDRLLPRERQRRFLAREGWVAWSGPAIAELMETLSHERYVKGGLVFGDRTVGLADVTCPVLIFIGEADDFARAPGVRAIVRAAPSADVYECVLPVGHFGLPVSAQATKRTWPGVVAWVRWLSQTGSLPDYIHPLDAEPTGALAPVPRGAGARLTYGIGLAAEAGLSAPGEILRNAREAVDTALEISREAIAQLPRLARLERMTPSTRISYGSLLDEAARRDPDNVSFMFEDRAHSHAAAKRRIDNVVRGLISVGVRVGEHVGVLMDTRPSALVAVAALNRLGAVAVMLRPDGPTARETQLAQITRLMVDPEHVNAAELGLEVLVLGGGGAPRELPDGVLDMERIDPQAVDLPVWYEPNPGRAGDLAFILFTGSGETTRADRITNGRWARSALGAASSASLTSLDTVYSVNPLHHPSGLLLATAAAAAGRSRLAVATRFDPDTFWSEVRRYGATVVPYTWTMLHELVGAPPHLQERHHPIRLFVGSGMPSNLWRRVLSRFAPAGVLELYASTRTGAIIGNVSGRKIGALGRPLPGMPRVRVVAYDVGPGRLQFGADGLAIPSAVGEVGMLLVEVEGAVHSGHDVPFRGVFKSDDCWIATGDLFRRDADGDLWMIDTAAALINTERGVVYPRVVEEALTELDSVDLAACYGVERAGCEAPLAIAAVTLRNGSKLDSAAVGNVLDGLDVGEHPDAVWVTDSMPMTSWYRPSLPALRSAGGQDHAVWRSERF